MRLPKRIPAEFGWRSCNSRLRSQSGEGRITLSTVATNKILVRGRQRAEHGKGFGGTCIDDEQGRLIDAANSLELIERGSLFVESRTYASLLQKCSNMKSLLEGKRIHAQIVRNKLKEDIFLENNLISMYAKCGSLADAYKVFDKMLKRNVVSWNVMISAYVHYGHNEEALKYFWQMQKAGVKPNNVTFISVLNACASPAARGEGKVVHAYIVNSAMESDLIVVTALVNMYSKCFSIEDAHLMFERMPQRDAVSWNVIIAGHAQNGNGEEALKLFWRMQREGMKPNKVTLINALTACAGLAALTEAKLVHALLVESGMELDVIVGSALISMYSKCARLEDAYYVFHKMPKRDLVLWNTMITGYAHHGCTKEAVKLFQQMQKEGLKPNEVTFINVLNACSGPAALAEGKLIHAHVTASGMESSAIIGNALIDMYVKCGEIADASLVFHKMPKRNLISWTTMISGCAQHGCGKEALELFYLMQNEGWEPNQFTFSSVLTACASQAALAEGKRIHAYVIKFGLESDVCVGAALVDMYAKCGSIEDACRVFHKMPRQDVVSWTAMIAACAQHGRGKQALELFQQMLQEGVKPDSFTVNTILTACSHAGLVKEGCNLFKVMIQDHCIALTLKHCVSMVDLLGRAGHLAEAESFINRMPFPPNVMVWMTLLGACRNHANVELAERAVKQIFQLEPDNTAAPLLLANIYGASGRWDDQSRLRNLIRRVQLN